MTFSILFPGIFMMSLFFVFSSADTLTSVWDKMSGVGGTIEISLGVNRCMDPLRDAISATSTQKFVPDQLTFSKNAPFCVSVFKSQNCVGPSTTLVSSKEEDIEIDSGNSTGSLGPCDLQQDNSSPFNNCPASPKLSLHPVYSLTMHTNSTYSGERNESLSVYRDDCTSIPQYFLLNSVPTVHFSTETSSHHSFCVRFYFNYDCSGLSVNLGLGDSLMDIFPYSFRSVSYCDFKCPRGSYPIGNNRLNNQATESTHKRSGEGMTTENRSRSSEGHNEISGLKIIGMIVGSFTGCLLACCVFKGCQKLRE